MNDVNVCSRCGGTGIEWPDHNQGILCRVCGGKDGTEVPVEMAAPVSVPSAELRTEPNGYGFGANWILNVEYKGQTKNFWLGQDVKVCSRLLGITPKDLTSEINKQMARPYGTGLDFRNDEVCVTVGGYILDTIVATHSGDGDPYEDLMSLQEWDLAMQ